MDNYDIGGVPSFVKNYTKILEVDNKIYVYGEQGNIDNPRKFFPNSKVFITNKTNLFHPCMRVWFLIKNIYFINKLLSTQQIDCIHLTTSWSALSTILSPQSWKKTIISTFFGSYERERKSQGDKSYLNALLRRVFQSMVLVRSKKIASFSQYSKNLIINDFGKKFKDKILIIPGIIDSSSKAKNEVCSNQKITQQKREKFAILNFGRNEPRKSLSSLLETTRILLDKKYNVETTIAVPIDWQIQGLLKTYEDLNLFENVKLIHKVSDQQKKHLLSKADIFVIPSIDLETFGLTIIESLSMGVPVIGTPIGAIPEILSKVDQRLISKSCDPNDIAKTIIWYLKQPISIKKFIQRKSIEIVDTFYSYRANRTKVIDFFNCIN